MNKTVEGLLYVDSHDSLVRLLRSWRIWLVGAILGALLASLVYAVFPPPYRARAVVVVDHNLEEVWDILPPRQFYFLGREARKLEELAWSDEVMQQLVAQVGDVTVIELREGILSISQPNDGGWHFFADHSDPDRAEAIASTWAHVFQQVAYDAIEISADLEIMRSEIPRVLEENPDMSSGEALHKVVAQMYPNLKETKGISPYVEISLMQVDDLLIVRKVPLSVYILAGAVLGSCGLALVGLIILRAEEDDVFLAD